MAKSPNQVVKGAKLRRYNQIRAFSLMLAGRSEQEIADELGLSRRTVGRYLEKKLAEERTPPETIRAHKAKQLALIEALTAQLMPHAFSDEVETAFAAIDRINRLMIREAKLLGLDAAVNIRAQVEHSMAPPVDLSSLTTEELQTVRAIFERAQERTIDHQP